MKQALESVIFNAGVAAVFNGHVHAYERSKPVYQNTPMADGTAPTYIVLGDGGNREGLAPDYLAQPAWSDFREGTRYGHSKITFVNITHALWQWFPDASGYEEADKKYRASSSSSSSRSSDSTNKKYRSSSGAEDEHWIINPRHPDHILPASKPVDIQDEAMTHLQVEADESLTDNFEKVDQSTLNSQDPILASSSKSILDSQLLLQDNQRILDAVDDLNDI
jgi:hypothetical protein